MKTETAGDEIGNEASPVEKARVQGVLHVGTLSPTDPHDGTLPTTPVKFRRRILQLTFFLSRDERPDPKPVSENEGSNLFVSGIAPRLSEEELEEMFGKYGTVEGVNIMVDPHTKESRGFGFVKMVTAEEAKAAKDSLSGEERYGRVLTIETARRARPRKPTLCHHPR